MRFLRVVLLLLWLPQGAPALEYADTVLSEDTVWNGEIVIKGVVYVKKGITLHIRPGTVVKFQRIDVDGDGVGDAELRVGGRLLARGTAQAPVVFTSAEEVPASGDWSYILLYASTGQNVLEHCRVEYAFSGVQVHHSKATMKNCLFQHNKEGVRFGKAWVSILHSRFSNNQVGIRYTRLTEPVRIEANQIEGNAVGLYIVPVTRNAPSFLSSESVNPAHIIAMNNFVKNVSYNVKVVERGPAVVNMARNWWGSADPARIEALIYDGRDDGSGALVVYEPYLTRPASTTFNAAREGGARR
jgi:hypothetical protein